MPTRPKIVVVGSANTDMVVKTERIPGPGETVIGGEFMMAAGGKGANQAVAAARLGAQVTMVGCLGRDVFGDQAIAGYQQEGIDTSYVVRDPDAASGVALIFVDAQGENSIAVASGANARLTPADVERASDGHRRRRRAPGPARGAHRGRAAGHRAGPRRRACASSSTRPRQNRSTLTLGPGRHRHAQRARDPRRRRRGRTGRRRSSACWPPGPAPCS